MEILVQYGYPRWNVDPEKVDTASILLKDGDSGQLVQIFLEETRPNSSIFGGLYSVSWANIQKIRAEFYIPPQHLLRSRGGIKKLEALIAKKKIRKRPFVLHRNSSGLQAVELYDTREQARRALKFFKQELALRNTRAKSIGPGGEWKQKVAMLRSRVERVRLEQVERRKELERLQHQDRLLEAEREERKEKARDLWKRALLAFQQGGFQKATHLFDRGLEFDPTNTSNLFRYGVSLYRTGQFNRSLVVLHGIKNQKVPRGEKSFFMGLNYYRLREDKLALKFLRIAREFGTASLTPLAAFYEGIILAKQKKMG